MADEWSPTTLGECIDVKHGFAFKGEFIHEEPDGDILLTPGNFAIGGGFKGDKFKYYSGPDVPEFILRQGDLLVSMTDLSKDGDTLGYPAFVPKSEGGRRFLHNQRLGKIHVVASTKINTGFLHYLLCSSGYRNEILGSATGSTVRHTSPDRIKRFEFLRPRVTEQRAIAHILGTLDDRIEANRRMAATLEEMARVLFRAWFVTFEPVRAKAEGRWRPGQTLPGLPASLYDLFPDRLVETEHGGIPNGWRWWLLEELAALHRAALTPGAEPDCVFEHYSIPAYDNGQEPAQDRGETIKSNKTLVPTNAILLSKLNPESNRVWLPKARSAHPKIASTEFLCFTPNLPAGRALLYSIFRGEPFRRALEGMVTGTSKSHQRVSPDSLLGLQVCPARPEVFNAFEQQAWPLLDRTTACREESRILAAQRDSLLPKLVSGAIRVKDAEGFLKARGL